MIPGLNPFFFESTGFTSSTFPIQPDFSESKPAAITLNTGSSRTLNLAWVKWVTGQFGDHHHYRE
jgi:hypothetical protein